MHHGYLLDMDGVIYRGAQPVPHAREFIDRLQARCIPFLLLTNHSCFTPQYLAQKLERMGLSIPVASFYTSAMATAEWLAAEGATRVFAMGEDGLLAALKKQNIALADDDVTHAVIGLDRGLTYEKFTRAARLIAGGARFIGTNPDPIYPVEDGDAPECGLLLGALQHATGQMPTVVGKPEPIIYHQAARRLDLPLSALTMIGDRLDTDIAGALGVGARGVLVLTGHTTPQLLTESHIQPDEVLADLSQLEIEI